MKIFFDNQIFYNQCYGGVSKYFVELIKKLKILNVSAKILGPFYINQYLHDARKELNFNGIRLNSSRYSLIFKNINNIFFNVNNLLSTPDIIHSTYYNYRHLDKKNILVVTVYDLVHELYNNSYYINTKNHKKKILERANHIICISESTKKDLINYYNISENKISVIYLAAANSFKFDVDIKKKRPYILYVGSRKRYKNFNILIDAYSYSKKINDNFDIVCFGGDPFLNEELRYFKEKNISLDKIKFIQGNDNLLYNFYKNASCLVYPSLYEGFGLPIVEAMSMSCPVISSNTSSMPEIYGDSAISFNPKYSEELIKKLENLLFDSHFQLQLKNKGLKRSKEFSWEKCAQETQSVYKNLIN